MLTHLKKKEATKSLKDPETQPKEAPKPTEIVAENLVPAPAIKKKEELKDIEPLDDYQLNVLLVMLPDELQNLKEETLENPFQSRATVDKPNSSSSTIKKK